LICLNSGVVTFDGPANEADVNALTEGYRSDND
jgi:hypothetical protein